MRSIGQSLRSGLMTFVDVLRDGLTVLWRHWPALLGWFLLGAAGRRLAMWLAVWAADHNATAGVLLLPLAPICTILALVMMLRCTRDSLPALRESAGPGAVRRNLTTATAALVPFLAVYSAAGLLATDTRTYLHANTADEWINNGFASDFSRTDYAEGWLLVGLVVVALVIRKTIAGLGLAHKNAGWAALYGYVEALWMITLGTVLVTQMSNLRDFVLSRAVVAGTVRQYQDVREQAGAVGDPLYRLLDGIGSMIAASSTLVVLPVAWLAIGAVVHGARLRENDLTAAERRTQALAAIPEPVRRISAQAVEPITTPLKETFGALGKVAAAGVLPMVLFCLLFVLAGQLQAAVAWIERWVVGPRESLQRAALYPFLELPQQAVYYVVAIGLLAAAVNRVVGAQRVADEQEAALAAADAPGPGPSAAPGSAPATA